MLKLNKYLMLMSFSVMLISFWRRHEFPSEINLIPQIQNEPKQYPINKQPFSIEYQNATFTVEPLYAYELHGLVVSYRHHDSDNKWLLHGLSNDHINVADLCVIWGDSANNKLLNQIEFRNGQFTCFAATQSNQAWSNFNPNQWSNNHLLAIEDSIRETIADIQIGDQIKIKGWLANYLTNGSNKRVTSNIRTDSGNGACETVYVNQLKILSSMRNRWRIALPLALMGFIISLIIYYKTPFQNHRY